MIVRMDVQSEEAAEAYCDELVDGAGWPLREPGHLVKVDTIVSVSALPEAGRCYAANPHVIRPKGVPYRS